MFVDLFIDEMKSKITLWFFIGITLLVVWSIVLPDSVEASATVTSAEYHLAVTIDRCGK